ncbi:hypothetical protein HY989_06740 [Candidatus Micrarchaeota archaeon]|nr:hypothetical protein [Candidatus Micrarchaeota archaeon]
MDGAVANILDRLVADGYFKTKTEALRAGILQLGREYRLVKSKQDEIDDLVVKKMLKIQAEIDAGRMKTVSFDEVLKKSGLSRRDLR